MWEHPATRRNVAEIAAQKRVTLVGPVAGEVASGEVGVGRMAEPQAIASAIDCVLAPGDLGGVRVVVTAGPTLEDIDPVRFIGNRSSGKMGFAIAERAAKRGARVTLIAGPVSLPTPDGVRRVDVRSALEMREALGRELGDDLSAADALVMAAAVADHRPAAPRATKTKKSEGTPTALELVENPDLLAEIGATRGGERPVLVGFAVETSGGDALVDYARRKLAQKRVDLVVANQANDAFGQEDNQVVLVSAAHPPEELPAMSKGSVADRLLDRVRELLGGHSE